MPVLSLEECARECDALRAVGRRVVFTNGCFDILHRGHVEYLEASRALGDALVVGVNSDASVRRLKGPQRPMVSERDRATIVAALRAVDMVVLFDADTPIDVIERLKPDVLVKGGDYDPDASDGARYIVGSREVRAGGGTVAVIPLVPGLSSTELVRRIASSTRPETSDRPVD